MKLMSMRNAILFLPMVVISLFLCSCLQHLGERTNQCENTEVSNSGNMINLGCVIQGTDDFYYVDSSKTRNLKRGYDGAIICSGVGRCFWFFDDEIYCMDEQWANLIRINVETGNQEIVLQERCNGLVICNGTLFYTLASESGLFSMDVRGRGAKKITDTHVRNLVIYKNNVYFLGIETDTIFQLSESGLIEPFCIISDVSDFLIVENGVIYKNNEDGKLYVEDMSAEKTKCISDSISYSFNVYNEEVIYTSLNGSGQIVTSTYNYHSGETALLSNTAHQGIFVANGKIYTWRVGYGIVCLA